ATAPPPAFRAPHPAAPPSYSPPPATSSSLIVLSVVASNGWPKGNFGFPSSRWTLGANELCSSKKTFSVRRLGSASVRSLRHPEVKSAVWISINHYNGFAAKRDGIEATVNAYLIVQSRAAEQFGIETVRTGSENTSSRSSISSRLGNACTKRSCQ